MKTHHDALVKMIIADSLHVSYMHHMHMTFAHQHLHNDDSCSHRNSTAFAAGLLFLGHVSCCISKCQCPRITFRRESAKRRLYTTVFFDLTCQHLAKYPVFVRQVVSSFVCCGRNLVAWHLINYGLRHVEYQLVLDARSCMSEVHHLHRLNSNKMQNASWRY